MDLTADLNVDLTADLIVDQSVDLLCWVDNLGQRVGRIVRMYCESKKLM